MKKFLKIVWQIIFSLLVLLHVTILFPEDFVLKSKSFENNGKIPSTYTADGKDISPQLYWTGLPKDTKSLVLIVDDPDAKKVVRRTWIHWIVKDISPYVKELPENVIISNIDAKEIKNDFDKTKYCGPYPPKGEHKYVFTLFALDKQADFNDKITPKAFRKKMGKHILAEAQLFGRYERLNQK